MRTIYLMAMLLLSVSLNLYGKGHDKFVVNVFCEFDTVAVKSDNGIEVLYKNGQYFTTIENLNKGVNDGLWISMPTDTKTCITGRYTDGVMSGIWNVYGEDGTLTLSISNITVLADDNNYFHKVLDTEANVYIGLWRECNGKDDGTRSYWAIFSDDFERDYIVIKRDNQLEQLFKSYNLL